MVGLKDDETLDDLLIKGLQIIQKNKGFRFTLDSVLLAHFAPVRERDRIVDLGTGTGLIPLVLSARAENIRIWGVEIQEEIADMASRSVRLNNLQDIITINQGDIRSIHKNLGEGNFTLVTCNPPYWTPREGKLSSLETRALARHELACSLEDVISCAGKLLTYHGRFAFIHRAERLADAFALLRQNHLEPRALRFIHPFAGKNARHVLVEARKQASPDLKVLPPLIVYEKTGRYTHEVLHWYGKEEEDSDRS